ncbi:hypothetical protein [Rathayibacter agropyri]|uniref:hypothetical protein n=1 Tax=Rathayibacter agropyri TaxID=1634927 RepID=UPI001564733D|nr:hypothetical protein [Rathayibacter agropyri]NRD08664.1 hypothetical protein [Rathayibacter agropyri]
MSDDAGSNGFPARPRRPADFTEKRVRLLAEADRLLARLERAIRDGREEFLRQ